MPLSSSIAGPSRSAVHTASKFSETEALDALKIGLRISQAELDNLFEQCDHCSQSFMRSALHIHINLKDIEANRESDSQTSDAEDMSNAEDDDDDNTMTDTSIVGEF